MKSVLMKPGFLHDSAVSPDWIDYNGHMRDAYYGVVFSAAIDDLMDEIGLDAAYREREKGTLYAVEDHRFYLNEVKVGATLQVETFVLDYNTKALHFYQVLKSGEVTVSVCESLCLHISQAEETPRAAPFPDAVQARIESSQPAEEHIATLTPRAGFIGIRRKAPDIGKGK